MKRLGLLLAFCASLAFTQQPTKPAIQLTQVPPKPTCHLLFNSGPCFDMWQNYNQALAQRQREELQLYVNRQKDIAASQATAPLQQQVAELNKLVTDQQAQIKKLNDQIQTDAAAAVEAKADDANTATQARKTGLQQGAGYGVGGTLVLLAVVFGIKRLTSNFTVTKKI